MRQNSHEDKYFYNANYTVSKLRAKKILFHMKENLIEGIGSTVTYINFVHPYHFMAVFDVLSEISYTKLSIIFFLIFITFTCEYIFRRCFG